MHAVCQVARILSAVPLENSQKLLKLQADLGAGDMRQIMAGKTAEGQHQDNPAQLNLCAQGLQMHTNQELQALANSHCQQQQLKQCNLCFSGEDRSTGKVLGMTSIRAVNTLTLQSVSVGCHFQKLYLACKPDGWHALPATSSSQPVQCASWPCVLRQQ